MFFKKSTKKPVIDNKVNISGPLLSKLSKLSIKLKLSIQISLIFIFVFSILLVVSKKIAVTYKRKSLESEFQNKGKMLSEIFANWAVKALNTGDDIFMLGLLNNLNQQKDVAYNVILDANGIVIAHTDVYSIGKEYTDDITKRVLRSNKLLAQTYQKDGKKFYDYGMPLFTLGEKIGVLRFGLAMDELEREIKSFSSKMNYLILGIIVFIGLLSFFLVNYKVSIPLYKIKDSLKLLGGQYLEYKAYINTKDEIGELSKSIESFIKHIKEEFNIQEERIREISFNEVVRLKDILKLLLSDVEKEIIVADVNNSIIFSNVDEKMLPSFEKANIIDAHLLDIINDREFISLLNDGFSNKGKVVQGIIDLSGKKKISVLTLVNNDEKGPKTIVVFEKVS